MLTTVDGDPVRGTQLESFVELVRTMREKQKALFTGRTPALAKECKRFERLVDAAVVKVLGA